MGGFGNSQSGPTLEQSRSFFPAGASAPKCLAFDIETAKLLPEETVNLLQHRPLGICCAATLPSDGELRFWHGKDQMGNPTAQMSLDEVKGLVSYLCEMVASGYTICTWNGLGFDFDVLAEESGLFKECRDLALKHIDLMFHFFCLKGFAIGLATAAQGMRLKGIAWDASGAEVPKLWATANYQAALDKVGADVTAILAIKSAVEKGRRLTWMTRRGTTSYTDIGCWLPVGEAMKLELPDTAWMSTPWPRSKFIGWLGL